MPETNQAGRANTVLISVDDRLNSNAVHLGPLRSFRAEFRALCAPLQPQIEFEFELDFSRSDPYRAYASVNDSRLDKRAAR